MTARVVLDSCLLLTVLTVSLSLQPVAVYGEWLVPDEVSGKVAALGDQQRQFVLSGAALEFLPERQLVHEFATRDSASLRTLVNELMALADEMGYDPQRDMGAIPLNIASKRFNRGTVTTPAALRKPKREPGPFSVHRYVFPESGVPTFAGAKVAVWPEDLVAGQVDVAIIGVPNDMSSGRRGAEWGPDEMRALNTLGVPDVQTLIDPLEVLSVVDYGNFSTDNMSTERTVDHVTAMVAETAGTGAVPMLVGGDTAMLYPGVKGVAQVHGAGSFGLLYLSAHPDAERFGDHTISDDRALFLLLDQGIIEGSATVQLGMRGPGVKRETLQWLRDKEVRYHTMAEIQQQGFEKVLKRVRSEIGAGPDRFFVAVDVSVVEPAEMVAAGRLAANGLSVQQAAQTIRQVCAAKDVVGFEITDLAPVLDVSRKSVANANALLNACLVGMAVKKAGLEPDFVDPLVADHGQR